MLSELDDVISLIEIRDSLTDRIRAERVRVIEESRGSWREFFLPKRVAMRSQVLRLSEQDGPFVLEKKGFDCNGRYWGEDVCSYEYRVKVNYDRINADKYAIYKYPKIGVEFLVNGNVWGDSVKEIGLDVVARSSWIIQDPDEGEGFGYVYFLRISGTDKYKIGTSAHESKRIAQHIRNIPFDIEVISNRKVCGRLKLERHIKKMFKNSVVHGDEWMELGGKSVSKVKRIINGWKGA